MALRSPADADARHCLVAIAIAGLDCRQMLKGVVRITGARRLLHAYSGNAVVEPA